VKKIISLLSAVTMLASFAANFSVFAETTYTEPTLYFEVEQKILEANYKTVKGSNSDIYVTDIFILDGEIVQYILNGNKINFQWMHNMFLIDGKTNLSKEELTKILEKMEFY